MLAKVFSWKVFDVANFIIALCNESRVSITHLKLQKLLFYVQWRSLAILKKEMFENDFEARVNWPVCKEVYSKYSNKWFSELKAEWYNMSFNKNESWFIAEVVEKYGNFNPRELVALTHQEEAWKKTRNGLHQTTNCDRIIPKDLIKKTFKSKL